MTIQNISKSNHYVYNSRNQRLHVKIYYNRQFENHHKGYIFVVHGYGSHINRPNYHSVYTQIIQKGYICVCIDFHGHGYSEGRRGFIEKYTNLVDDLFSLIQTVFGYNKNPYYLDPYIEKICKLPFYLMGHSMGGGVSILLSIIFCKYKLQDINAYYRGMILFSPLSRLPIPNGIGNILKIISNIEPTLCIPSEIYDENIDFSKSIKDANILEYILDDGYPRNITGLSYGGNIMFGTLYSLYELCTAIQNNLSVINQPLLILHDKSDDTTLYKYSEKLISCVNTSNTKLMNVNGLHDIMLNEPETASHIIIDWLEQQTAVYEN